jgi:hypothetical protein
VINSSCLKKVLTNEQLRDAKKFENEKNYEEKWDHYDSIYKFTCLQKAQLLNEWLNIAFDEQYHRLRKIIQINKKSACVAWSEQCDDRKINVFIDWLNKISNLILIANDHQ